MKWEYKIATFTPPSEPYDHAYALRRAEEFMNRLGDEGWEIIQSRVVYATYFMCKRPKQDVDDTI